MAETLELWELCRHGHTYSHTFIGGRTVKNAIIKHCEGGTKHIMMPLATWDGHEPIVTLDGTIGVWAELADE